MAFNPKQIPLQDLTPSSAVGVNLPLNGPSVFKPNYKTIDSVKSSLINFFLTDPGERYLNPSFGGGIKNFIFEQISNGSVDFLQRDLESKIQNSFQRVNIDTLDILRNDNNNQIIIKLSFSLKNTNLSDELTLSFE